MEHQPATWNRRIYSRNYLMITYPSYPNVNSSKGLCLLICYPNHNINWPILCKKQWPILYFMTQICDMTDSRINVNKTLDFDKFTTSSF